MEGDNVPNRATYLIDEDGIVQHEGVNNKPIGRNVAEFIRIVDALAHNQKHGEVCPANWEEGSEAINETSHSVASYLSKK